MEIQCTTHFINCFTFGSDKFVRIFPRVIQMKKINNVSTVETVSVGHKYVLNIYKRFEQKLDFEIHFFFSKYGSPLHRKCSTQMSTLTQSIHSWFIQNWSDFFSGGANKINQIWTKIHHSKWGVCGWHTFPRKNEQKTRNGGNVKKKCRSVGEMSHIFK